MLRQYIFTNLYERLGTRPFLSPLERRWAAFQLLHAVSQLHSHGACHGDIKCENVLVTSWGWVLLSDMAPYKPSYLPADNPADFSFFFDTGGRRRCYLAPERLYEGAASAAAAASAPLQAEMVRFAGARFADNRRLPCVWLPCWCGRYRDPQGCCNRPYESLLAMENCWRMQAAQQAFHVRIAGCFLPRLRHCRSAAGNVMHISCSVV